MAQAHILIIDDDVELTQRLTSYLNLAGYQTTVAKDPEQGLIMARSSAAFDIILLDVMLPNTDGYMLLKTLRQTHHTPVILFTESEDEFDRVLGLEMGADDFLSKPVSMRELLARIKALLRRVHYDKEPSASETVVIGPLALDNNNRKVSLSGLRLDLTGCEFSILQLLMLNQGKTVDKHLISMAALGRELSPFERTIDMHISNLRKKIACLTALEFIRTVRGCGYMLVSR